MSYNESDPKFPGSETYGHNSLGPAPSRENPAGVYPRSDPNAASYSSLPGTGTPEPRGLLGNPYLLGRSYDKLDHALTELIDTIETEEQAYGHGAENPVLEKFRKWRDELDVMRSGRQPDPSRSPSRSRGPGRMRDGGVYGDSATGGGETEQEGGMFTD